MTTFSSQEVALLYYDALDPVPIDAMTGLWKGQGIPTGHPLDGVLENLGWFGKRFNVDGSADALLFRRGGRQLLPIDPSFLPVGLAFRFSGFGRSRAGRNLFSHLMRPMRARGPVASIRKMLFRGKTSAAMVYDAKPIIDHFRWIDGKALMGAMSVEGHASHYFFRLDRVEPKDTEISG